MAIQDNRVREVAIFTVMPNWWPTSNTPTHPVGVGIGWNERKKESGSSLELEMQPVFVDTQTSEAVIAGCTSLLNANTGQLEGNYLTDPQGRYLVLSSNEKIAEPAGIEQVITQLHGKTFSSIAFAQFLSSQMRTADGRAVLAIPHRAQEGSMFQCGETALVSQNKTQQATIDVYAKQISIVNTFETILGTADVPAPKQNVTPATAEQQMRRAGVAGLVIFGNVLVRFARLDGGSFYDDSSTQHRGQNIDPTMVEYAYLADAQTGAYLVTTKGEFFRVNSATGQAELIPPQKMKPVEQVGGGGFSAAALLVLALIAGYSLWNPKK